MSASFSNLKISGEPGGTPPEAPAREVIHGPEVSASPADPTMLRKLYAAMLRCLMVEQRAHALTDAHKLKPPFSIPRGLEATAVGSLIELRAGDAVASNLGYATRMFVGYPLGLYFAELYGVPEEYLAFAPHAADAAIHLLPQAQTVAGQLNAAAGFALAIKKSQQRNVALVHMTNGASALGYWHEAASLASAERLPIIFVAISESVRAGAVGASDARQLASRYGIPGIAVDGGDVVAMWRVAQESIHRARSGTGPTLIDSQVPAVPANGSTNSYSADDPLARMQHYLRQRKLWGESWKDELTRTFAAEIDEAQAFFPQAGETQ